MRACRSARSKPFSRKLTCPPTGPATPPSIRNARLVVCRQSRPDSIPFANNRAPRLQGKGQMKKRTGWLLGAIALTAGAVGAATTQRKRRKMQAQKRMGDVWARPGMMVTFRAELMPGRERDERTFRVKELLPSGRISLHDVDGEHTEKEFEPVQFDRPVE